MSQLFESVKSDGQTLSDFVNEANENVDALVEAYSALRSWIVLSLPTYRLWQVHQGPSAQLVLSADTTCRTDAAELKGRTFT